MFIEACIDSESFCLIVANWPRVGTTNWMISMKHVGFVILVDYYRFRCTSLLEVYGVESL